jgi:ketosteroid isomerase-like protein
VNARDAERALACWAPDARILVEARPTIEGAAATEFARRLLASSRLVHFSAETERIEHSGNLAYELGRFAVAIRQPDGSVLEDRGKYLDVWKKHGRSDWRIIAHAPSRLPAE